MTETPGCPTLYTTTHTLYNELKDMKSVDLIPVSTGTKLTNPILVEMGKSRITKTEGSTRFIQPDRLFIMNR